MPDLPRFFYAEPQFRASSVELAKLNATNKWTLDTPGADVRLALDYYRTEMFATKEDRDAACGPTACKDVRYVPASRKHFGQHDDPTFNDIACGYAVDHPRFDETVTPIFDAALSRLARDLMTMPQNETGVIASTTVSIARVHYSIAAVGAGDWIKFRIGGLSAFEKVDRDLVDRTTDWLHKRVILKASPSLVDADAN